MRWDINQTASDEHAIESWKQWDMIRATLAPIVITDDSNARALLAAQYDNPHPNAADIASARAVMQYRRQERDDKLGKGKGLLPYPVYVATLPSGKTQRLSFWSAAGKPINFAHGFNVSMIVGRAVPVAGYVEHNGARIDDPYFAQGWTVEKPVKKASPALRLAAICKALNEGEIDAALLMAKSA
jgi:hypothetical protein